jgi:hypothetical protein
MLELLRLVAVPGAAGVLLILIRIVLKHGPKFVRTVMRERTRSWLARRAVKGRTKQVRKDARDVLKSLESAPPDEEKPKRRPDSIGGPDG